MTTVEFFFDYSSPWTYLAFDRIEEFCEKNDEAYLEAFPRRRCFQQSKPERLSASESCAAKDNYYRKDMNDWARYQGITLIKPSVFP